MMMMMCQISILPRRVVPVNDGGAVPAEKRKKKKKKKNQRQRVGERRGERR